MYKSPQISLANEKALIKLSSNSPLDISFFVITILKRAEVRLEDWVYAQILCRPPSLPQEAPAASVLRGGIPVKQVDAAR